MMRHSDTEWLDVTTHFYFKYLESKGPTLGLDIFQEYFSPELPFMRHQAFPSPNNSLSTLDPFCTRKDQFESVTFCLPKHQPDRNVQRCKFKCRLLIPYRSWRARSWGKLRKPGARGKGARCPIKRTWLLQGLFQTGEWEILAINS